jgi:hypothetical protein
VSASLAKVRKIVKAVPPRNERAALEAFGLMREMFDELAYPCPMCGHPVNVQEAGTHIRTGYREPHVKPYLPGSWLANEEQERTDVQS